MLSIFIMLFIAIGIAAGIGYAIVTLINTAQVSLAVQQNQIRLQNISTAIRAGLTTDDGTVLLPITIKDGGQVEARLPKSSPFNTTTSGRDIVYCPAFPKDVATDTTVLLNRQEAGDELIPVATRVVGGQQYLAGGNAFPVDSDDEDTAETRDRLTEMGVVAYLLSPQPNFAGSLYCRDVRISPQDNYTLLINGGSAVPIYSVTTDSRGSVFVLSEAGLPPGYNGSDRVVKTFADVGDFMRRYQITDVTVKLPASYEVDYATVDDFLSAGRARTIRLVPGGRDDADNPVTRSVLTLTDAGGADTVYLKARGNLVIDNLVVNSREGDLGPGPDIGIEAGATASVVLVDAEVSALKTTGGRIATEGSSRIVPRASGLSGDAPIVVEGGEITVASTASPAVDAPASSTAGVFSANAGTINLRSGLRVVANPVFPGMTHLFATTNGGRIVVSGDDPVLSVDRGAGYVDENASPIALANTRQTVVNTCANGSTNCEVSCPSDKVVDFGYCSTSNDASVSGFAPVAAESGALTSFSCSFSGTLAIPQQPQAFAVYDFPK